MAPNLIWLVVSIVTSTGHCEWSLAVKPQRHFKLLATGKDLTHSVRVECTSTRVTKRSPWISSPVPSVASRCQFDCAYKSRCYCGASENDTGNTCDTSKAPSAERSHGDTAVPRFRAPWAFTGLVHAVHTFQGLHR